MTILKPGYLRWDGSKYLTDSNINISLGGDVAGNNTGVTVIGLQGRSISSALPGDGFVLAWSATANSWQPISLTADLGPAGGDLSGTYPSPTVAKIQGNSVKNILPTDGYVLTWVNSNNRWEPLAPSGGVVLNGDVSGPAGSNTVNKINGATVPASGALTTGYVLQVSGSSSLTYGPVGTGSISPGTAGQIFVTNATPASAWTSLISYETVHGRFQAGGSGTDWKAIFGPMPGSETSIAGLWLAANAVTPASNNYTLWADTSTLYVNVAGATANILNFMIGNVSKMQMSVTQLTIVPPTFGWTADVVAPTLTQTTSTTAAGQPLTVTAQSTSFLNANGGNLNLHSGTGNGTGVAGNVLINVGATQVALWSASTLSLPNPYTISFSGNGSFTTTDYLHNFAWEFAGTNNLSLNATSSANSTLQFDSHVTSATLGTNTASATLTLQGGTQVTVLSLKAPGAVAGTGNLSIIGSIQNTYRSVSATTPFTVDTTTTDAIIRLVAVSPAQTVTLPTATVGRVLEFLIDLTGGGGDSTITFSAAANINGAASPLIIGPFVSGSLNRLLCRSDGTNWFISG